MLDISFQVAKILTLAFGAFALAMILTPWWTNILYKYRLGKQIRTEGAPIFTSMHKDKEGTPTMGGVIIWLTTLILIAGLAILKELMPNSLASGLSFYLDLKHYYP